MDELKPCPFCGGEALALAWASWRGGAVVCTSCKKCELSGFDNEAEAIAAWNTRAERTCKSVTDYGYKFRFTCSACGYVALVHNCSIRYDEVPTYCPNCGAKVVDE